MTGWPSARPSRRRTSRADVEPGLLGQAVANPMHMDAGRGLYTSDGRARALVDLILSGARDR